MKEKYKKLLYKREFVEMVAFKIGIKANTVQNYFTTNNIPPNHFERVNKALDSVLALDQKITEMRHEIYKNV